MAARTDFASVVSMNLMETRFNNRYQGFYIVDYVDDFDAV